MSDASSPEAPPSDDEAIGAGASFAGLDASQHGYVRAYLRMDKREWFFCCSSACDPCVRTIGRAVDHARGLLGLPIEADP
jgi:hypothetical protein